MDKKKLQQIIIILPIVLIAGIWCYCQYLFFPLNAKKKKLADDLSKIKSDYQDAVAKTSRLPELEQEIVVLNQEITELQKVLPESKNIPDLLRKLTSKMDTYNISWDRLTPGTPVTKDYYMEYSYTIPFKTTYHDLAMFMSDIGQMERIFSSRFASLSAVTAKDTRYTVSGELTFLFYTAKG